MVIKKRYYKYIPFSLLLALLCVLWACGVFEFFELSNIQSQQKQIEQYIMTNKVLSALIYIAAYILVVAVSLPCATFMTLIGGFLFGQLLGTIMVVFAATIGATILFVSAKLASQDILRRKAGDWAKKMQRGFQEDAFSYMLTLRLIPLFPFVAINLAAALLQIKLRTFFFATLVGIIPGSFVYVTLGTGLHDLTQEASVSPRVVLAFVGLGILALLPVVYKKIKKK